MRRFFLYGKQWLVPGSPAGRATALAVAITIAGALPVAFISIIQGQLMADVHMTTAQYGMTVSLYWVGASLSSVLFSSRVRLVTEPVLMSMAAVMMCVALAGFALSPQMGGWLMFWMLLGGIGNTLTHPASNASIIRHVPLRIRATVFGIKQAAIPAASLLAGMTTPLVSTPAGWRGPFLLGAALTGVLAVATILRARRYRAGLRAQASEKVDYTVAVDRHTSSRGRSRPKLTPFLLAVIGLTFFAAGHANSMGVFIVGAVENNGASHWIAAGILAIASGGAIVSRILVGILADRGSIPPMLLAAVLLGVGAVGLVIMAVGQKSIAVFLVGAIFAFAGSWGWPGLVHYAVGNYAGSDVAFATMSTQSGSYIGSTVGPIAFGVIFGALPGNFAWGIMAVVALVAVVFAVLAHVMAAREQNL